MLPSEYGSWIEDENGKRFPTIYALVKYQTASWHKSLRSSLINYRYAIFNGSYIDGSFIVFAYKDNTAVVSVSLVDWNYRLTSQDKKTLKSLVRTEFHLVGGDMITYIDLKE